MLRGNLSGNPVVVTGSANISTASVKDNDENMLIVRGDQLHRLLPQLSGIPPCRPCMTPPHPFPRIGAFGHAGRSRYQRTATVAESSDVASVSQPSGTPF